MKVCFYGLGSIGKRHLSNLAELCRRKELPLEVHAIRKKQAPLPDELRPLIQKEFFNTLPQGEFYDAVFITNPTALHFEAIQETRHISRCFFVEKPVFQNEQSEKALFLMLFFDLQVQK